MVTCAREVMRDAATLLQDRDHVRWRLQEMRIWLNAGLREISLRKPTAKTSYRRIDLAAGTRQAVGPQALGVLSVIRNVSGPTQGRSAIRMVSRADMDAYDPDWHDESVNPALRRVTHAFVDPDDQRTFWVYPPNDGSGRVEILTSDRPEEVPLPDTGRDDLTAYNTILDIDDIYVNALIQYVVYACYAKDIQAAGNAARAAAAFQQFAAGLGVKTSMEIATTPTAGAKE